MTETFSTVADVAKLPSIEDWIDRFCVRHRLEREVRLRLLLVIEELLTNVAQYGGKEEAPLHLTLSLASNRLRLVCEDEGIAFDPTPAERCRLPDAAALRPGGLGLPLIRSILGRPSYARDAERNRHEFEFSIDGKTV